MNELESNEQQLEIFKASFEQGIDDMLEPEMAEFLFDEPKPIDSYSFTGGLSAPTLAELDPEIKRVAKQVIYQRLGLSEGTLEDFKIRTYTSQVPEERHVKNAAEVQVSVYRTVIDGLYLQELLFQDQDKSWVIGPDQNI